MIRSTNSCHGSSRGLFLHKGPTAYATLEAVGRFGPIGTSLRSRVRVVQVHGNANSNAAALTMPVYGPVGPLGDRVIVRQ
jgi:hypothetical protein